MKTIRIMILLSLLVFNCFANAQTEEMSEVKTQISELSKNKIWIYYQIDDSKEGWDYIGIAENILVLDDRIEFSTKKDKSYESKDENTILYFSDLVDSKLRSSPTQAFFEKFYLKFKDKESSKKLVDNLILIQNQLKEERSGELVNFELIAARYREIKVKTMISDEQRKYIVQANSLNEQKEYKKAIDLYLKAIEVDQTAFPGAYSNLALLSAQINKFDAAIYYMKKYLMLEPESEDARFCQDKIYEWEIMMQN